MPYWRLSAFYFFYFASIGALIPYWNPYLKSHGFSDAEIGELVAIILATKIVAPNVWGWIADHTGKRMRIIRLASLLGWLTFIAVIFVAGYWWLAMVMVVFSFFWNASLPQFEATTMSHLGEKTYHYNSIRLWGSVGFILAVFLLGLYFDLTNSKLPEEYLLITGQQNYSALPYVIVLLFVGIWLSSLFVPEDAAGHLKLDKRPLSETLMRREVLVLLIVVFLLQVSHGPYYVYYTRYLTHYDYSHKTIGGLWSLGVIAEIVVFVYMARLLKQFGARGLMLAALLVTAVRWFLIAAFPASVSVIVFSQGLHAASFGIVHAVSIVLIHRYFTGVHQGRGQALYSSLSFGLGGAIGSLYCGYLWDRLGDDLGGTAIFIVAGFVAILAFVLAWYGIERPARGVPGKP